jgi:sulfatase maturation enzyme AslB (radical SAM superfamily)
MKSLKAQNHFLASTEHQLEVLESNYNKSLVGDGGIVPFQQKLEAANLYPLKPTTISVFQINVGKMCNQVCAHCHVDAGPDRKEIMTTTTMQECLTVLKNNTSLQTVDLTGGAPEMNPDFRWFVEQTCYCSLQPHHNTSQ